SDIGTASMSLFAVAVAVLVSATSLHRELEQKTLFPILARPIERGEYLVGKYLGTLLTVAVFVLADAGLVLCIGGALAPRPVAVAAGAFLPLVAALVFAVVRWPWARTYGPIPWAAALFAVGYFIAAPAPDERSVVVGASVLVVAEVAIVAAIATV